MNKRLVKYVEKLQSGERASVRRDQIRKAIEEGGFDYLIYKGYDEVYSVDPVQKSATLETVPSYWLDNGDMWAGIDKNKNALEITIKYGYSYIELFASLEDKKEEVKTLHTEEVKELAQQQINTTEGITVEFNEEKNGIEISFASKELATEEIRTAIKSVGFRYYAKFQKWICKQTPEAIELVHTLFSQQEQVQEVETIEQQENINNKSENNSLIGYSVIGFWGAMHPYSYGTITSIKNDIVTIDFEDNEDFPEPFTTELSSLKTGTVKEIGVYIREPKKVIQPSINETIEESNNDIISVDAEEEQWDKTASKYELIDFENITTIETLDKNIFINCLVPSLNKNCTKEENDKEILESSYLHKFRIQKIVKLNYKQYKYFINNLLSDYAFLSGNLGGWEEDDNHKFLYYYGVAVVCDNEETLIIDPSGSSYARYCNKLVEDIDDTLQTELNTLDTKVKINNTLYNEAIESIKDNLLYEVSADSKTVIVDNRYIKNIAFNGVTVVTGKTIKELIQENKGINILKLQPLKTNIEHFIEGLQKHDTKQIFSLFPTATDKAIENIKFMDRLQYELSRSTAAV